MTPAELDEHRTKNLCFFCHDKYSPGHNCAQRRKTEVFFMEVDEMIPGREGQHSMKRECQPEKEEEPLTLTLNSLFGNVNNNTSTMQLKGSYGSKTLHIFIGISHNFLSNQIFRGGAVKSCDINLLKVTDVDGRQIKGTLMVENFS